jgi:hypothetical protein
VATIASTEFVNAKKGATEDCPDAKRSTGSFEPMEDTKTVQIDPDNTPNKVVRINTSLSPK